MVHRKLVYDQLHAIGFNPFSWGRSEVHELCNILMDGEQIIECVNGEYSNGFALLAATNHRILLVDKKPFLYLTVEDVRFEQISDFNYRNQFITANITISTANKTLHFMSYNKKRLRKLIHCVQERVIEMRENQTRTQALQTAAVAQQMYGPLGASATGYGIMQAQLPQFTNQFVQPQQTYVQSQAATATTPPTPPPAEPPHHTSFGVYTRSKLPSFHRHQKGDMTDEAAAAESEPSSGSAVSGELYPQGYTPRALGGYRMPLEY